MEWKEEFTWIKGSVIAGLLATFVAGYFIIQKGSVNYKTLFLTWIISTAVIYGICVAYRGIEKINKKVERSDTKEDE
jgi:heme O synthase-like polyprenyltransferase